MRAHKGLAAVALAFIATTAASHAASVLQVRAGTGTPATVTGGNDYPFLAEPLTIRLDGVLETTGAGKLTFEYLGYEAAWINSFLVEGEDCFTTTFNSCCVRLDACRGRLIRGTWTTFT